MPLPSMSSDLALVYLSHACPSCGDLFQQKLSWFVTVGFYRCHSCGSPVELTYPEKVELYESHAAMWEDNRLKRFA
jgi:hypothetical protein